MTHEIELSRTNVTPGQFFGYIRSELKKHGFENIFGLYTTKEYEQMETFESSYHDEADRPCKAEIIRTSPYHDHTFVQNWDGNTFNQIVEFDFDEGSIGHGYFFGFSGMAIAE